MKRKKWMNFIFMNIGCLLLSVGVYFFKIPNSMDLDFKHIAPSSGIFVFGQGKHGENHLLQYVLFGDNLFV